MLVLSRKLGQRFQLGQDVRITIVKIDRHNVRIGIEAPDGLAVQREEIIGASAAPSPPPLKRRGRGRVERILSAQGAG